MGYNLRENYITERAIGTLTGMLRKQTTIPAEWDKILPMTVFAYNSAPHDATRESPFYILHAFDPNGPSKKIPRQELSWRHIEFDYYKFELLNCIEHAQRCAKEINEEYGEDMKEKYDRSNKVEARKLPKVGDRAYMELPRERVCRGSQNW
ncbi:unnamed protein product [Heligmosomoides polygyrus]|uniref:Integrase catalytic domain-containing protein n=1 Tax=Heligmosomoides polygyrus TaxID=6339 RepID=A0A183GUY7_HELPZ|nr:unnamed protein product [Heligmosomoides polygyrus]